MLSPLCRREVEVDVYDPALEEKTKLTVVSVVYYPALTATEYDPPEAPFVEWAGVKSSEGFIILKHSLEREINDALLAEFADET